MNKVDTFQKIAMGLGGIGGLVLAIVAVVGMVNAPDPSDGEATGPLDTQEVAAQEATASVADVSAETASPPPVIERRTRKFERYYQNGHCQGTTAIDWWVQAQDGWEIDVTTIDPTVTTESSKSAYFGIVDDGSSGFRVTGRVANNGSCVKVFGEVVARDGRGHLGVQGTYEEFRRVVPAA